MYRYSQKGLWSILKWHLADTNKTRKIAVYLETNFHSYMVMFGLVSEYKVVKVHVIYVV